MRVQDDEGLLLRQELETADEGLPFRVELEVADRAAGVEGLDDAAEDLLLGPERGRRDALLEPGGDPLEALLGHDEVGDEELVLDRLEVLERVGLALKVGAEAAQDDGHGVAGADELHQVAGEGVGAGVALADPGEIGDVDRRVDGPLRPVDRGELGDALVGDLDRGDVRPDAAGGVGRNGGGRARQRVEERRLSRLRQSDEPDLHVSSTFDPFWEPPGSAGRRTIRRRKCLERKRLV